MVWSFGLIFKQDIFLLKGIGAFTPCGTYQCLYVRLYTINLLILKKELISKLCERTVSGKCLLLYI